MALRRGCCAGIGRKSLPADLCGHTHLQSPSCVYVLVTANNFCCFGSAVTPTSVFKLPSRLLGRLVGSAHRSRHRRDACRPFRPSLSRSFTSLLVLLLPSLKGEELRHHQRDAHITHTHWRR